MPMYDYTCRECGNKFEELVSYSTPDAEIECPECKKKNAKRMLCAPSISTKGSYSSSAPTCNAPSGFS